MDRFPGDAVGGSAACGSYKPCHDMETHKTYLKPDDGTCLHCHVCLIGEDLGLCSLRVPMRC